MVSADRAPAKLEFSDHHLRRHRDELTPVMSQVREPTKSRRRTRTRWRRKRSRLRPEMLKAWLQEYRAKPTKEKMGL